MVNSGHKILRSFPRRSVLAGVGGAILTASIYDALANTERGSEIIDTHVHLFDTQGAEHAPWPPKSHPAYGQYGRSLPSEYESIARPHGIVGAIAVEASPRKQDNNWLRKQVESSAFMKGFIGNFVPGSDNFSNNIDEYSEYSSFLGIRYGNLWGG